MRNPIRLKNLRPRFLPFVLLAGLALWVAQPGDVAFACGALFVLLGGALRSWGAGHLVKNDRLSISGPYARLRHPLYLGTLLIGVGFATIAGGIHSVVLIALLLPWFFWSYFPRKERIEGDRLTALYGDAYRRYHDAVAPLIPSLHPWQPSAETTAIANAGESWSRARYGDNNELGTLLALLLGLLAFGLRVQHGS